MGCQACNDFQDSGDTYYFRWNKANIGILGCREHVTEVIDVLRREQEKIKEE